MDEGKARLLAAINFPLRTVVDPANEDAIWWLTYCRSSDEEASKEAPRPEVIDGTASFHKWVAHTETTSVHEAGHAVAMILAGRLVRDLQVFIVPKNGNLGMVRPKPRGLSIEAAARSPKFGAHGLAREMVIAFAGPAAELRFDPSHYHSGRRSDWNLAFSIASELDDLGMANRWTYLRTALVEAHQMMADDRVWSAVTEIADSIRTRNVEHVATMGGKRIQAIVQRHLPDGWAWSGTFAAPAVLDSQPTYC